MADDREAAKAKAERRRVGAMKRSAWELMLQEAAIFASDDGLEWSPPPPPLSMEEFFLTGALGDFTLVDRDEIDSFFADDGGSILNNATPNHSNISAIESSYICAGTPTSSHKPGVKVNQAIGGTGGSDQSDEDSFIYSAYAIDSKRMRRVPSDRESARRTRKRKQAQLEGLELQFQPSSHKPGIKVSQALGETGGSDQSDEEPFDYSTCDTDIKRVRRMISNRESARRSRRRKQAQLEGLQLQVDQLRSDKSSLSKQLTGVNQEFNEAVTNNYILKSNVEALRMEVKMAENLVLVSRRTLACSGLEHLLPSNAGSPQFPSPQQPCQSSPDLLPAIDFQEDDSCFIGVPPAEQFHNVGVENNDAKNTDVSSKHCER